MLETLTNSINAEELPAEEFRFVKAQQDIYNLCQDVLQNEALKSELQTASHPEEFLNIAAENGYEFAISDLQAAISWALEKTEFNSDESDDYELSEEELEMIAGGPASRRSATNNSYWHETGILVEDQCFYLTSQSLENRALVIQALQYMEKWDYKGNGEVEFTDLDGNHNGQASYTMTGFVYNGSTAGMTFDLSQYQIIL